MRIEAARDFGVEITDFDLADGRAPGDIAALRDAYDTRHLLIFRGEGPLAPARQVEITRWFGTVVDHGAGVCTVLDNAEASGSAVLPFHSDITFVAHPLDGISLHPLALPYGETSTTFVSNAVGWTTLDPGRQALLERRTARHFYDNSAAMAFDWPTLEHWHPVRMIHPRTGRPLLFVTEHHVDRISDMAEAEGRALLAELFATLYAPERRYEHVWRTGDLLVWDNYAVQHARTRPAAPSEGSRIMQRVAMGAHGFMAQVEQVRQAKAAIPA